MAKAGSSKAAPKSRGDIVQEIAAQLQVPNSHADAAVRAFEEAVVRSLKSGSEVRLTGFGSFKVSQRAARTARNPQTGAAVKVAARKVPRFTAGQGLKEAIGGGGSKGGAAKAGASKGGAKGAAAKAGAKGGAKGGAAKAGAKGGKKR